MILLGFYRFFENDRFVRKCRENHQYSQISCHNAPRKITNNHCATLHLLRFEPDPVFLPWINFPWIFSDQTIISASMQWNVGNELRTFESEC